MGQMDTITYAPKTSDTVLMVSTMLILIIVAELIIFPLVAIAYIVSNYTHSFFGAVITFVAYSAIMIPLTWNKIGW